MLVRDALVAIGFDVIEPILDGGRARILRELNDFSVRLGELGPGAIGFIYYSGHGVSRPRFNTNYLIPVDVTSTSDTEFWWNAIALETITSELKNNAPEATAFVVIDACRNELRVPLKALSKGFNNIADENGLFIALSTSPNTSASDEGDEGGPYSNALASELRTPGQDHLSLFQNVKRKVFRATRGVQRPWESNGLIERVYLSVPATDEPMRSAPTPAENASTSPAQPPPTKALPQSSPTLGGTPASFCSDLKGLADLTSQGFSAIRVGAPRDDEWPTNFKLAGYDRCRIRSVKQPTYNCTSEQYANKSLPMSILNRSAKEASVCLGRLWRQSKLSADAIGFTDDIKERSIMFAVYEMGVLFGQKKPHYYLVLQVYSSKSSDESAATPSAQITASSHPADKPKGYCDDLKRVTQSSMKGFSDITGTKIFDGTFRSKVNLNGWNSCDINTFSQTQLKWFSCELPVLQGDRAVDMFVESMVPDLQTCLGEKWALHKRTSSDGRVRVSLRSSEIPVSVEVRSRKSRGSWQAMLDVNMEK